MNPIIEKKCIKHYNELKKIFPNIKEKDPLKACRYLRKIENIITKISTFDCNGLGDTERNDNVMERLFKDIKEYLQDKDNILYLNTDPRGYALKIRDEVMREKRYTLHIDMGGYGIIAPEFDKGVFS